MRVVQRVADGLLGMFVPKVTASAIYYWQYRCIYVAGTCAWRPQRQYCYCHDSGGGCSQCSYAGCC
jgi:hypothetical protein